MAKLLAMFMALLATFSYPVRSDITKVNKTDSPRISVTQSLTIMTYNVKVSGVGKYTPKTRADNLIKNVLEYTPDSIGFEEVSVDWYGWLKDGLKDYAYVGEGRDGNGKGEASPVFYLKNKYKLIDSGTFWLSETPDEVSKGWDAMNRRVCTYAVLQNIKTGFRYAHFSAHFDHIGLVAREEAVSLVTAKIKEVAPNIPVVFTGDLNEDEDSEMYNRIIASGLRDSKYIAKDTMDAGTYHGYSSLTEKTRTSPIDFIFVNSYAVKVDSYKVDLTKYDGIYPSDHHPIIVKLTLGN